MKNKISLEVLMQEIASLKLRVKELETVVTIKEHPTLQDCANKFKGKPLELFDFPESVILR